VTAYAESALFRGQPNTSDQLLYTVPASTTAIVAEIIVANTTGTAATITIGLDSAGTLAAANHVLSAVSVAANTTVTYPMRQVLTTGKTIRSLQGTSTALTVHIAGILIT
jgi:hypothetical protein